MNYGFTKASVHNIAKNATVTTGALYTRYKNKDEIFCSLVQNAISAMSEGSSELYEKYNNAKKTKLFEDFYNAIKAERSVHIELFFKSYDEYKLVFCKSEGSSIEKMLENWLEQKILSTAMFMQSIATKEIDAFIIKLILTQTFNIYKQIFESSFNKSEAISFLKKLICFMRQAGKPILTT